jgi:hypothetical protein
MDSTNHHEGEHMKTRILAAALAAAFSGAVFAQAGTVQRDVNQQNRIEQGLQSGQLTDREAARLERGQARDSAMQARAGADGRLGPREQQRIQRNENRQSRHIHREKHDAQQR